MIIALDLNVVDNEGNIEGSQEVILDRGTERSVLNKLKFDNVNNISNDVIVKMSPNTNTIEVVGTEDTTTDNIFIGSKFGVVSSTEVDISVIFLKDRFLIQVLDGAIDLGTDDSAFIYTSKEVTKDLTVLENDSYYTTEWVTVDRLFAFLNTTIKDEFKTGEYIHRVTLSNNGSIFSMKRAGHKDISFGVVDQMDEERKQLEIEEIRRREQSLLDRDKRIQDRKDRELAEKGAVVNNMFQNLLRG